MVSKITRLARSTINRGEDDLDTQPLRDGRVRRAAGASRALRHRPRARPALKRLVQPATLGDAVSTFRLLESIEALYPLLVLIHVFFLTTRAIPTPNRCRNGLLDRGAGSSCISFRPIARI
jgi:hypothetical protein